MKLFGFNIERRETTDKTTDNKDTSPAPVGANVSGKTTYAQGEQTSLTVPAFYRAITLRADTMARLTMQYQRKTRAGNYEMDDSKHRGKHLNYLLQVQPNPHSSWTTMMRQAEIMRLLRGNAYIYIERGLDGEVQALWLCSSGVYDPTSDSYTVCYYMATVPHMVTVPATQVIHLRNTITAIDGFTGMPLLQYAARTLNLSATQDQFTLDTFSKGGRYKMLLQEQQQGAIGVGGKVNRDQMEKAREKLQKDLPNNDVVFVPNVASVTNMSQTLGEMELSTMRKLSVADISRLTGVPRNLLGDDSNSSYKTPEAATLDFLSNGIAPQIEELEDEFNRKLLGEVGWGEHKFVFDVTPLFRLDRDAQGAWNKNRLETGVSSINELRAEQNLAPIVNGYDHYVSTNLAVAGSPKLTGEIEKGVEP